MQDFDPLVIGGGINGAGVARAGGGGGLSVLLRFAARLGR